ncbi:hypothetical protein [Methanocalculus chunghsingensis]|nr:hypothetical protein [Methanocalculus chunghsingensis]
MPGESKEKKKKEGVQSETEQTQQEPLHAQQKTPREKQLKKAKQQLSQQE